MRSVLLAGLLAAGVATPAWAGSAWAGPCCGAAVAFAAAEGKGDDSGEQEEEPDCD